ncbi:hypothetical protein PG5_01920 [Pseudomonas sp. G5(2012)]|nr:hypothetical protein PG5_01920 [Pseudomonas sp. G5(2012)]
MAKYNSRKYNDEHVEQLIMQGKALLNPAPLFTDTQPSWLLEGGLGEARWITQNGGKEYYEDNTWHNTCNIDFDIKLPDGSGLLDPPNNLPLITIQKWAYLLRSGQLGNAPGPKYWSQCVTWALNFTRWIYLRKEVFSPQTHGYTLVDETDLSELFDSLSQGGWCVALLLRERVFTCLYYLAFKKNPSEEMLNNLPIIDENIKSMICDALLANKLYLRHSPTITQTKSISRQFLSDSIYHPIRGFKSNKIRLMLRTFENDDSSNAILAPIRSYLPNPSTRYSLCETAETERVSESSFFGQSVRCAAFFAGGKITDLAIPSLDEPITELARPYINELKNVTHQKLIPVDQGLKLLNEAALWITMYSSSILNLYEIYISRKVSVDSKTNEYGYYKATGVNISLFDELVRDSIEGKLEPLVSSETVLELGFERAFQCKNRNLQKGRLSLIQSINILIGACAYAIGMLKPMREGELTSIPFSCIATHTMGGCWLTTKVEKSAPLGAFSEESRPIPYLTYRAVHTLQLLGVITAKHHHDSEAPPTLFYFGSRNGFKDPAPKSISRSVSRCMDFFCDYLALPLDEHGRRNYFRVHQLRKFFLLMLTWTERHHGWECGAWMAAHQNPDHLKSYTEANLDGSEISEWEAEYAQQKLMALDLEAGAKLGSSHSEQAYREILRQCHVKKISRLSKKKFESYVKMALASGEMSVELVQLPPLEGSSTPPLDIAVIIRE